MLYLDLDELPQLFDPYLLWSARKPAVAQYRRIDHFGDQKISMAQCVRNLVEQQTGQRPSGAIRLLTHLRYFGYCMNPVSFFFCWNANDSRLEHIVAEVSNTPWNERFCYVLSPALYGDGDILQFQTKKNFHVSPFMPMNLEYMWRFIGPNDQLRVGINVQKNNNKLFNAEMLLSAKKISQSSLNGCLIKYPLITANVVRGIHWQAFRLWLKKTPFYPHPGRGLKINKP